MTTKSYNIKLGLVFTGHLWAASPHLRISKDDLFGKGQVATVTPILSKEKDRFVGDYCWRVDKIVSA